MKWFLSILIAGSAFASGSIERRFECWRKLGMHAQAYQEACDQKSLHPESPVIQSQWLIALSHIGEREELARSLTEFVKKSPQEELLSHT